MSYASSRPDATVTNGQCTAKGKLLHLSSFYFFFAIDAEATPD